MPSLKLSCKWIFIFPLVLASCGSSGGGVFGKNSASKEYRIATGRVDIDDARDENDHLVGYVYPHSDGDIVLKFPEDHFGFGPHDLEIIVDDQVYDGAFASQIGWEYVGTIAAAGFDLKGNKFAVSNFLSIGLEDINKTPVVTDADQPLVINNIKYVTNLVSDDSMHRLEGSGYVRLAGAEFTGQLRDITISGTIDGIDIKNGKSILKWDGKEYHGDLEGVIFYYDGSPRTMGSYVSTDEQAEVLFAGGWQGKLR